MREFISKKLSPNDLGLTGSHQAGILVPKIPKILDFFPWLDSNTKNPRVIMNLLERGDATKWEFCFIHYNNKYFGGTRNEYRLTRMTKYFRAVNAKVGDELLFERNHDGSLFIHCNRREDTSHGLNGNGVLVLGNGWKVIKS